jgi:hypothetical protein
VVREAPLAGDRAHGGAVPVSSRQLLVHARRAARRYAWEVVFRLTPEAEPARAG